MKKIIAKEWVKDILDTDLSEIIKNRLNADHHLPRTRAAILIGLRINEDYDKYSELLLQEMNKSIHFGGVRLGVPSAFTIAVALIENLQEKDYPKIKETFDKWEAEDKDYLLGWLSDFPDHKKILLEGKL